MEHVLIDPVDRILMEFQAELASGWEILKMTALAGSKLATGRQTD
jgi:hypothetical protein